MKKRTLLLLPVVLALCCTTAAADGVEADSLPELFTSLFTSTITEWMAGLVNDAFEVVDNLMLSLLDTVFHAEHLVSNGAITVLTPSMLQNVYAFLYTFACGLVVMKFLLKGFQIYILWRDGDADVSPGSMAMGLLQAVVTMLSFPYLYEIGVDIFTYLADGIIGNLGFTTGTSIDLFWVATLAASGLIFILFSLVFFILVFILWIRLMVQGFELLILRLGLPLATIGLIDSDAALFKNYLQVFFKTGFTVIIQVTLMSLAFRVAATFNILNLCAAIALMVTALSSPKLLQQFLIPAGGGGLMQKAYTVSMVARTAQMLFR